MAAECQSRLLAELIAVLDGMWACEPVEPCREQPAYEVHVEHVCGLRVALCGGCLVLVSADPRVTRWVKLRPTTT